MIEQHAQAGRDSLFIYQELITGAMRYVGELWEHNEITVADEHLATSVCEFVLSRYHFTNKPSVKHNKKAMFLCVEDELHDIGQRIVGCLFEELGWDVRFLGASLPLEHALSKAAQWQPDVIGLSVSIVYNLPKLTPYIEAFHQLEPAPRILVGGRLVSKFDLAPYCGEQTVLLGDLPHVHTWLTEHHHEVHSGVGQRGR